MTHTHRVCVYSELTNAFIDGPYTCNTHMRLPREERDVSIGRTWAADRLLGPEAGSVLGPICLLIPFLLLLPGHQGSPCRCMGKCVSSCPVSEICCVRPGWGCPADPTQLSGASAGAGVRKRPKQGRSGGNPLHKLAARSCSCSGFKQAE